MMKTATLFLVASVALAGCAKTVEGESKRWQQTERKARELATLHPGFKAAIEGQLSEAKKQLDAAQKAGGEAAADQMAKANQKLARLTGPLGQIDRQIKALEKKSVQLTSAAKDETARMTAKQATDQASRAITDARAVLKRGATTPAQAVTLLSKAQSDLKAADGTLSKLIRKSKAAAKTAKTKAVGAGTAAGAAGTTAAAAKAAPAKPWTCEYCGSKNDPKVHKCASCGASQGTPKKSKKGTKKK